MWSSLPLVVKKHMTDKLMPVFVRNTIEPTSMLHSLLFVYTVT